nr:hypothetical protein [Tanacetum cinerariifolium]
MTQLTSMFELVCQIVQKKQKEKRIEEEQAASARYWKIHACCDDDDNYNSAITPVLSTEETDNSLSMGNEHLDTIPATESNEVIKSSVEDLVLIPSEFKGIPDTMCDVHLVNNPTPLEAKDHFEIVINSNDDISSSDDDSLYKENIEYVEASPYDFELVILEAAEIVIPEEEEIEDDNLCKKLLNVRLLIANIEALKDNPAPSSEFLAKSSSTSPKSFLEETNTFHNSLPEFENFCFDLEEISSGSTTTHSDISLSEYDSFIFDLSKDQFLPTGRSDLTHEEFVDELAHIISPPEYDFEDDYSPLLTYVIWIFLAYLTYPVVPPYLHSFGNKDTIFDPCITINRVYSFKPGLSHRCGAFKKFNTHRSHLNEWPMIINGKNIPILDVILFHFYPLDQLNIPGNLKTLAKGFYPPSLKFPSFSWESKISSGSTTTHSDIFLSDYEAFYFYDDHIEEISSGISPTDRSDFTHEELADELAHIISPPEYDCFYFRNVPIRVSGFLFSTSESVKTFLLQLM